MIDPLTILTVFAPLVMDVAKAGIAKFTGNKPPITSVEDYLKTQDSDVKKLEALAKMDLPSGETYKWVVAARTLQRPIVVYTTLATWTFGVVFGLPIATMEMVANLASSIFFYLFGERGLGYIKTKKGT